MTTPTVVRLLSGGALLDGGGVPQWHPTWRDAQDEADARSQPRDSVDYPGGTPMAARQDVEVAR